MRLFSSIAIVAVSAVTWVTPAVAQNREAPAPRWARGYLIAGAGSLVTDGVAPVFSVEIAERATSDIQVYAAFSYYDNLMSDEAHAELDDVSAQLSFATGTAWRFQGRDRGRSMTAGAKYLIPTATPVRPFVGAGIGVINLRRTISEQSRGNLTAAYVSQFGGGDGIVDVSQTNTNKPLGEFSAGVAMVVRRAYVQFEYRFGKPFHSGDTGFDIATAGVAAGIAF
jgi:hypothetical protein